MTTLPPAHKLRVGDSAEHDFVISQQDMEIFQRLSADTSLVHTDAEYARQRGYRDVIVYGGLMLAQLSHIVGQHLPGVYGTSAQWSITYRSALYVNEPARIRLEIVSASVSTGLIEGRYKITSGERLIAQGQTQSMVPLDMIDDTQAA
jgi:acyl dehydratase